MNSVPRLFPNATIVCIGGGPSLTAADVEMCRGRAPVVAISDAWRLAPWADVLYSCDPTWWRVHGGVPAFGGLKYGLAHPKERHEPGVIALANTGDHGLEREPSGLRAGLRGGSNSGYQAINLSVHLGASRIVLLGYDMQPAANGRTHWFGAHSDPLKNASPYGMFRRSFEALVDPLRAIGVVVVNASRQTALTAFPRQPLDAALKAVAA